MTIDFIKKSSDYRRQEAAWQQKYDRLAPKKGDLAPDFELFATEAENKKLIALVLRWAIPARCAQ